MKKSLIALAVLGFTGAAMAQSSVTLYGVADAGIGKIENGSDKTEFLSGSVMNNGGSRVGVRGVEDLGGGLKAGFTFETGLNLDDGSNNSAGAGFWGRTAKVWLGGGWGTFSLGRDYTASFKAIGAWELTGSALYSVVGNTYRYLSAARDSSIIGYATPNMGGFTAEVNYILKQDGLDAGKAGAKWDLGLKYVNGPIGLGASANKTKNGKTNYHVGGKYNFGSFAVATSYSQTSNAANQRRRGFSLGGSANLGAFALTLDLTRDTKNEIGGKKYTNGVLEGKYALSKRTFLYAAYLRFDDTNNYGIGVRHNF